MVKQSQCTFPRFLTGLVLTLLLPTPTIWFSVDHKRNVSDGVVSGIGTLFSLDHKLYASDYDSDSDSVVSENKPSSVLVVLVVIYLFIYLFTSFMDTGLLRGNLHERDSGPMQGAIPTQYHNP